MFGQDYRLATSSRTDSGVHGWRHPVTIITSKPISISAIQRGLNALTPKDIAIIDAQVVPLSFGARRDAIGKTYQYHLYQSLHQDPYVEPYAWRISKPLNLDAMRKAGRFLIGKHDFSAFRASHCDARSPVRQLHAVHIGRENRHITITVNGNAFLRNMVRIIAGNLVEVGVGRFEPDWMAHVLESKDRGEGGRTAPGRGLFLLDVSYPTELVASGAHEW